MNLPPSDIAAADQAAAELARMLNALVAQVAADPDGRGPADPMQMGALALALHVRLGDHTVALLLALAVRKLATHTRPTREA